MSAGSITALVETLVAAGCTPDMILAAVRTAEATKDDALERSRENTRNRVKRWRDAHPVTLQNVTKRSVTAHASASPARDLENKQTNKQENKKERATRLPTDWQTPDEWIDEAVASGLSRAEALTEANRMKNWSISTKGAVKLDWHATWRNWFLRFLETRNSKRSTGPPKKLTQGESLRNMARERGIIDDTGNPIRRLEASDGDGEASSSGHVVRFAVAGNHGW